MSVVFDDDENGTDWSRLRRKVEEGLAPAEERVAQKLKSQIADATTPNFLLAEFRRYFELMKRDGLKRALRSERETLLSAYADLTGNFHASNCGTKGAVTKQKKEHGSGALMMNSF